LAILEFTFVNVRNAAKGYHVRARGGYRQPERIAAHDHLSTPFEK
jgi:hypothetical protein